MGCIAAETSRSGVCVMKRIIFGLAALFALCGPQAASAQGLELDEIRAGVMFHNVYSGFLPTDTSGYRFDYLEDVSFSALFASPDIDAFRWIGSPRPEIGATVSLNGRENLVHANLLWQFGIFDTPLYIELGFGAAVTDGALTGAVAPARNMGCAIGFYESAGIGAHLSDTVTATLRYEHTSNLELCSANEGLSNLGLMIGFKF